MNMKVTAFVGSARKKHTYKTTEQFMHNLQSFGDVECEIVSLSDFHIEVCKGCMLCLNKSEELCPFKDGWHFFDFLFNRIYRKKVTEEQFQPV